MGFNISIKDAANSLKEFVEYHDCSYEQAWCYMNSIYTDFFDFHEVVDVAKNGMIYSTGAIIDTIKAGQVAIREFEPKGHYADKFTMMKVDEDGDLSFYDEQSGIWIYEYLRESMIKSDWRIIKEK